MAKLVMTTPRILHAYWLKAWSAKDMSEWAEQLLLQGRDTAEICMLAAQPDAAWDRAQSLFRTICAQIGLSNDIDRDIQQVLEREWLKSYEQGEISGAALMWCLAPLQKRLGLPQVIGELDTRRRPARSRYYTLEGLEGETLETLIRDTLVSKRLISGR